MSTSQVGWVLGLLAACAVGSGFEISKKVLFGAKTKRAS
jgi:hypothetical protein